MDFINDWTGEKTGHKSPLGFEHLDFSERASTQNDRIIWGYGCRKDTGKKAGYYYIPLECVNCRTRFWEYEPESQRDEYELWIKQGVKISDIKCPICGCQTLRSIQ